MTWEEEKIKEISSTIAFLIREETNTTAESIDFITGRVSGKLLQAFKEHDQQIITEMKKIEDEKWNDADHCSCLRYAIDKLENGDENRFLKPSIALIKEKH